MSLPKFRRLYFPGLISLVLLPMMWICYLISNNTFHKYRKMTVDWTTKDQLNRWLRRAGQKFDIETSRKYKTLTITGNSNNDNLRLNDLKQFLNNLQTATDTINGRLVYFSNNSKYQELVTTLDICYQKDNIPLAVISINNKIYIFQPAEPPKSIEIIHPTWTLDNDVVIYKPKRQFFSIENIKAGIIAGLKPLPPFWAPILIFILMLYFTINKKKRYLNLKTFRLVGPLVS